MNRIGAMSVIAFACVAGCSLPTEREKVGTIDESIGGAFHGAIHTTTKDGSVVNENVRYADCRDVYLTGGPRGGGPALPEGDYYFMVTSPSGGPPSVLLSSDAIAQRKVHVGANGEIDAYLGETHTTGTDVNDGSVTVQLWPFAKTPNPGGEYKAWLTPVEQYNTAIGTHGFVHRWSKTDNFKCDIKDETPPPPPPPEEPCDNEEC